MTARKPRRIPRWTYWIAGIGVLAMVSGFAIGSVTVGGFSTVPHQATATSLAPVPPAGVGFPLAEAELASATSTPAAGSCVTPNLGTRGSPEALTSGTNSTLCLTTNPSGFAVGDLLYILDVSFNTSAPVSTVFEVQVFLSVTPATNDLVATGFVETSATVSATEVACFAADITESSDSSVNGFTVIVTQLP